MRASLGFCSKKLASLVNCGPDQASGFSAHPKYQEAVNFLDDVYIRLRRISTTPENQVPIEWLPIGKMSERVGFNLNNGQYKELTKKLDNITPFINAAGASILDMIRCFAKEEALVTDSEGKLIDPNDALPKLDRMGWARATGTRKTAVANVILKPHNGEYDSSTFNIVNEKPMHRYFQRFRDLHVIAYPLKLTDRLGKYVVDVKCRGGGPSGQAGALRLALSKALVKAEPGLRKIVSDNGLLVRDPRGVERKKPGQEKARAKFAWVKR
jgi:small subunit ribosomal protein S9